MGPFAPLRDLASTGLRTAVALTELSVDLAASAAATAAAAGLGAVAEPIRTIRGHSERAGAAMVGVNTTGLAVALAGRALRLPPLPGSVEAAVAIVDYQPRLRRLMEERIGSGATDTVLEVATAVAHTVTLAPASLAVDLAMSVIKAGEQRAVVRARSQRERVPDVGVDNGQRAATPPGPVELHARRSSWIQAIGAPAVGAVSGSANLAGTAALVAAPKAARTTRESFAATLGRGLAARHAVLPLRPDSLRRLDRVDMVIIDPRVLHGDRLRVVALRGVGENDPAMWERAQAMLVDSWLCPGWHRVAPKQDGRGAGRTDALLQLAPHPLAAAVLAETHRADVQLISVDVDTLAELRSAFDELIPLVGDSVDETLAATLSCYQRAGHTVAVVSAAATQALSAADVALGIVPDDVGKPVPGDADLLVDDLAGVWRILHALPAAKAASRRGVKLSTGASALGTLLLIPSVRGRGPGPVTAGAAAGLLSGYWLARNVVNAPTPRHAPVDEWHAMSVEQVRAALAAADPAPKSAGRGQAQRHLAWQFLGAVRAELADPLTPVMGLGAAASAILGSPIDAMLFTGVLTGNAMLAAGQQLSAERRLDRLLAEQAAPAWKVTIEADGARTRNKLLAEQLRPGDLIEVGPNDVVPADARIVEQTELEVDEASLTGESLPVAKQIDATPGAQLAERACMLFAGTTVVSGAGLALVTNVGADTQERRAAELVTVDHHDIGLGRQLARITSRAWPVSLAAGALVSALGVLRATPLREAVGGGVSVAVAAVPEGMPVVATLAQHASAQRLTKTGVLVRVPRSVEALGRVDVVCFDKTGTLSQNRLQVTRVQAVPGSSREEVLRSAAQAAPIAKGRGHAHATDAAIVAAADELNGTAGQQQPDAYLPFRSGRAFSASVVGRELTVKGAPEVVLAACRTAPAGVRAQVDGLAGEGLRVLAVARRTLTARQLASLGTDPAPEAVAALCGAGLSLLGLLGIADTPRDGSAGLLAELSRRGVPVRIITGDHPVTARAIARTLNLPVTTGQVISGAEWEELSRKQQERAVAERVVFARMSPANKVQIVQTLERTGRVCAMVGDGANDAAAIRAATIGIGVVAHGSDAAHTAADVVLLDGRVESLLTALDEGAELWQRVQSAVAVLLGGNASGAAFAIIGSALTGRTPLNTRQLLLVNIVTDALPATALAISRPNQATLFGGRGPDEAALLRSVALRGTTTASATTAAWLLARATGLPRRAATVALVALVTTQLGQTLLESRAPLVLLTAGGAVATMAVLISTPGVSHFLGCTPLGPLGWAQALGCAGVATTVAAIVPRFISAGASARGAAPPLPLRDATAPRTPRTAEPPAPGRPLRLVDPAERRSSTP